MKTVAVAAGETVGVLFPIVDPIGNLPTFLGLTARHTPEARRQIIRTVVIVGALVSVLFTLGERVLRALPPGLIVVINLVFGLFVMAIGVELVVHGIANHGAIVRVH